MSEHGTRTGGRNWWLIGGGALGVLALGVGLGTAIRPGGDPAPQATAAPAPSTPAPSATPELPKYTVTAGRGGSSLAVDGKTQIGYPHDCEGAIAAATNYASSATRLDWVKPYGDKLLDQIADADTQSIEGRRKGMRTALDGGGVLESHPEWGGFRVVSCDQYNVTVMVWECLVVRANGQAQRSCTTVSTVVSWVNSDWKLRRYDVAEDPAPEVTPDIVPGDAPLPADQRRQALQAAGPGWQEYANAPQ